MFVRTALIVLALCFVPLAEVRSGEEPIERIAFGSCAKQDQPQPIWDTIVAARPELFLFIGDNIYGDTQDMEVLKRKWGQLGAQAGFRRLKETCPVLAVWDDHDYGANDAGVEYPKKKESQQIFLDFFEEPADSPRRTQEGIYAARVFGPPGRRIQVILLDTRYFRSPLVPEPRKYEPGEGLHGPYTVNTGAEATVLGETQWRWLEEQLKVPAELRIVASSIQVIPDEHWWEKWGNFPHERQRLFETIRRSGANGVVFISGDRHAAEISKLDAGLGYPLYDVTSSSLNAPGKWRNERNPHRVGVIFHETNFGMIEVDWDAADPVVRLQVRNEAGDVVLQDRTTLGALQPSRQ